MLEGASWDGTSAVDAEPYIGYAGISVARHVKVLIPCVVFLLCSLSEQCKQVINTSWIWQRTMMNLISGSIKACADGLDDILPLFH